MEKRRFLTARWENLIMLNYEVDPEVLNPYIPPYTELDLWQGKALVSVVGFMFADTKVWGISWPWHTDFEEINLRFYVRYFDGENWKRGAVFISEIVPKPIIPLIANTIYNEHYKAMSMSHSIFATGNGTAYKYDWKLGGKWNSLQATIDNIFIDMIPDGPEQFIFEHYWGYNKINDSTTLEYAVEHPAWQVAKVMDHKLDIDIAALYGDAFVPFLTKKPYSAFFAKGSEVAVRVARKITSPVAPGV